MRKKEVPTDSVPGGHCSRFSTNEGGDRRKRKGGKGTDRGKRRQEPIKHTHKKRELW